MKQSVLIALGIIVWLSLLAGGVYAAITVFKIEIPGIAFLSPTPRVSCVDEEVSGYLQASDALLAEWQDIEQRAPAASRIALSPIISDFQRVRREFNELSVPECSAYVHDLIQVSMNLTIDAYLIFQSGVTDEQAFHIFSVTDQAWAETRIALKAFRQDPAVAYQEAEALPEGREEPYTFANPQDWTVVELEELNVSVSIPPDWTVKTVDDLGRTNYVLEREGSFFSIALFALSDDETIVDAEALNLPEPKTRGSEMFFIEKYLQLTLTEGTTTVATSGYYGTNLVYFIRMEYPAHSPNEKVAVGKISTASGEKIALGVYRIGTLSSAHLEILDKVLSSISENTE